MLIVRIRSFASSLTAFDRRAGLVPATWNAKGLKPHNAPCAIPSLPAKTANVTFNVYAPTQFNENIFMVGNIPQLANYNVNNAIALSYANAPTWSSEFRFVEWAGERLLMYDRSDHLPSGLAILLLLFRPRTKRNSDPRERQSHIHDPFGRLGHVE